MLCWSSREETPHAQGKRNPSKMVGVARGHQRADTLKPYSQKTSQSNHTGLLSTKAGLLSTKPQFLLGGLSHAILLCYSLFYQREGSTTPSPCPSRLLGGKSSSLLPAPEPYFVLFTPGPHHWAESPLSSNLPTGVVHLFAIWTLKTQSLILQVAPE